MATQAASFDPLRMGFILGRDRVTAGDHTLQRQAEVPRRQRVSRNAISFAGASDFSSSLGFA